MCAYARGQSAQGSGQVGIAATEKGMPPQHTSSSSSSISRLLGAHTVVCEPSELHLGSVVKRSTEERVLTIFNYSRSNHSIRFVCRPEGPAKNSVNLSFERGPVSQ
eukprot:GHVU01086831.1.p1 GENE.GHVU01086831.1~~GHVU01086831.1.p1  ORF type:complete len:106 (-),score=9.44 GHVU01086831.1:274-591(-)